MNPCHLLKSTIAPAVGFTVALLVAIPASADLVGYWPLNEASWDTDPTTYEVVDASGTGNDGTARYDAHTVAGGKFDRAGSFDGSGDRVNIPADSSLVLGSDGTISVWVKLDVIPAVTDQIFGGHRYQDSFLFNQLGRNLSAYWMSPGGKVSVANVFEDPAQSEVATWHHLAVAVTATSPTTSTLTTYVDGANRGSATVAPMDVAGVVYDIGGSSVSTSWTIFGLVDDAAIWNEGLDTGHVRSLYTVPEDLGLDYDTGDMIDLWDIHALGPGGGGLVDGRFWEFTANLPGSPNQGDAYEDDSLFYVALGNGTGVRTVPEPSTFILCALGLLGLGFCGRRRMR